MIYRPKQRIPPRRSQTGNPRTHRGRARTNERTNEDRARSRPPCPAMTRVRPAHAAAGRRATEEDAGGGAGEGLEEGDTEWQRVNAVPPYATLVSPMQIWESAPRPRHPRVSMCPIERVSRVHDVLQGSTDRQHVHRTTRHSRVPCHTQHPTFLSPLDNVPFPFRLSIDDLQADGRA